MLVNAGEEEAFSVGVLLYPITDGVSGTWLSWVSSPLGVSTGCLLYLQLHWLCICSCCLFWWNSCHADSNLHES